MKDIRKAWDPEIMGFNKHDYRHLDPATVNVEEYAKDLRGEQNHFGDIREYDCASNKKHPENDASLDWLGRPGTVFETDALGFEGQWMVSNQPVVHSPETFCRARSVIGKDDEGNEVVDLKGSEMTISCVSLGCAVNKENEYQPVRTKILRKARVDKSSRTALTVKK